MTAIFDLVKSGQDAHRAGDRRSALRLFDEAILSGRTQLGGEPHDHDLRHALIDALMSKARAVEQDEDLPAALTLARQAEAIASEARFVAEARGVELLDSVIEVEAWLMEQLDDFAAVRDAWDRAIAILRPLAAVLDCAPFRDHLIDALIAKRVFLTEEESAGALALLDEAEVLARRAIAAGSEEDWELLAGTLDQRGITLRRLGRHEDAAKSFRESIRWTTESLLRAERVNQLAHVTLLIGEAEWCGDLLEWSVAEYRASEPSSLMFGAQLVRRGLFRLRSAAPGQAARDFAEAVEIVEADESEASAYEEEMFVEAVLPLIGLEPAVLEPALSRMPAKQAMELRTLLVELRQECPDAEREELREALRPYAAGAEAYAREEPR